METITIEIPDSKTKKLVTDFVNKNQIIISDKSITRSKKPKKKLLKTEKEKLENDGMYKLMQEVNFSEKVSLDTIFRKLGH